MTPDEINALEDMFAAAALRAKAAGFDAVELHAAHGYFLSQSLSPYYNRRTDKYGGSAENRARLLTETYVKVREAVGGEYPVLVKINCSDFAEGEATFAECECACRELDGLGIDGIEISGGDRVWATGNRTPSLYADYAARIADEVRAPVILVGNNRDPEAMERILNETNIAFLSMARPFPAGAGAGRALAERRSCAFALRGLREMFLAPGRYMHLQQEKISLQA
jgi:2,4-dienoyl-CoA reductase-like NADH-dependent reductase (Old Yellow Enzyme family)